MARGLEIARLRASDIAAARAANRLYAEVFGDAETYLGAQPDESYLAALLAQPSNILIVATQSGSVVGALTAYELRKFERAHSEIYIYDLAVAERCRRQGVARALIAETQAIARQSGAWVIFVQADHGDAPAIALYSRLGQREDVLHFDIDPGAESTRTSE